MADDFESHGFEVVTDENGNELVKLMFMDENNQSSGYALVSSEDAKKIMNGEATLQNIIDEEGKQVLTLVPVEQDQIVLHVSMYPLLNLPRRLSLCVFCSFLDIYLCFHSPRSPLIPTIR